MCEKEKKSFSHRKIVFFSWWRGRAEREEIFFHCGLAWKPGFGFGGRDWGVWVDRSRAIFSFLFIFPPPLLNHFYCSIAMPARYSPDLRSRVVWHSIYLERSPARIALLFFISLSTVFRILREFRTRGHVLPHLFRAEGQGFLGRSSIPSWRI